jgi:hypothetical protein
MLLPSNSRAALGKSNPVPRSSSIFIRSPLPSQVLASRGGKSCLPAPPTTSLSAEAATFCLPHISPWFACNSQACGQPGLSMSIFK